MPPVYPQQYYSPGQGMQGAMPLPGASVYPPEFSYGLPQGFGQQTGPASWAASAVGNVPSAMSTVGMMAGLGTLFSASPVLRGLSFLDPTTAGIEMGTARFMAARAAGMGVGGALGSGVMVGAAPIALGMAAYQGAAYTGQQFMTGAREQQQLGAQLSGIGFANPMAPTGRGFGFQQQRQIGAMMREIDAHDPFTTMHELNNMMDQFTGMGMHRGVQDAREFGKKFKEFTKSIHDMAMELGTTMEEATRTFGAMRQAGFYTSKDVMGNARSMQMSRGLGMDEDTFLRMQGQGASITRSALVTGRAGAMTSARFAQDVMMGATSRASGGLGLFTDEQLMDMTGAATGSDAAAMMGTQFTGMMTGFLRNTPGGRAFLAGLGKQRGGSFTGEIDGGQLSKFAGGNVRLSELAGVGQGRLTTAQSRASFVNNEHKITSSLMESEHGVEAVMKAIDEESKRHFRGSVADDDAMVLFLEKVIGADKQMAEKVRDIYKNYRATQEQRMRRMREEQAASLMQLEMRRNYTFEGLAQQVTGGISDAFAPVRQAGADFNVYMQETGQSLHDNVMGINRASMNETSRRASIGRFMTGRAALLPATQTGMSNFDDGTVGRSMATSGAIWEGQSGINRAAALQRKLAMGGKLSVDDLELGKEGMGRIDMFLASDDGQRAREAILRAKQARALGDEKGAEAELDRARGLLESGVYDKRRYDEKLGIYVGDSASMRNTYRNSGLTDRYLAAAMIKSGDASGAAAIAGKGEVTSNAYGDVKAAQTRAIDALEKAGVESGLAKQLAGGGVGAELFIKTAGNATLAEQGRSHEALTRLAMSPRVAAMLSDVSPDSDEYFEILSQEASKKFGGSFSGEDVRAVMQAESQVRSSWHGIGASYIRGDRDEIQGILSSRFARAGKETLSSIDTRTALSAIRSAGTALGGASEEMKAALGDEYGRAVKGLARVGSGEKLGSAEMLRVQGHLDALLARAGEAGVGGMLGGQELGLLAEKRSKALSAARSGEAGSLQSIAQAYGLRGSDAELIAQIEGMGIQGINKDQQLTVEEMESAVRNLASQDLLGSLSAGEGGGIFLRGMTHEQQVAFDMQRTAASVQKMAEAVDAFHTKVFNPDEKTQKPAGK